MIRPMTTLSAPASQSPAARAVPTRFRETEDRSRRLGRPLRAVAGIRQVDESLMARLGRGLTECDEAGAALASAMRGRSGPRVSHGDLQRALDEGITDDTPLAVTAFIEPLTHDPAWLDRDLLARGQRVYHRFGRNAADVLLQLSLIGGYRFGGPTDLLVATGGLTEGMVRRRLGETQLWATRLSVPGALEPHAEAWRLTLHVRAMHALVNDTFLERGWDVGRWGLPVNDTDQAGTLGLFDGVALIGVRALGVPVSRADSAAVMHLWKYVGWLMGVHEDFLTDSERERHRINYHVLLSQTGMTDAGRELTQAIVDVQAELFDGPRGRLRGRWEQERLLSMLTVFLGRESMREFGVPIRPPWAHAVAILQNLVRYRLLGRGTAGRARLERWGDTVSDDLLARYFEGGQRDVGALPG